MAKFPVGSSWGMCPSEQPTFVGCYVKNRNNVIYLVLEYSTFYAEGKGAGMKVKNIETEEEIWVTYVDNNAPYVVVEDPE